MRASFSLVLLVCALAASLLCASPAAAQTDMVITYCDPVPTLTLPVSRVSLDSGALNGTIPVGQPIVLTLHGLIDADLSAGTYSMLLQRDDGVDGITLLDTQFGSLVNLLTAGLPVAKGDDAALTFSYTINPSVTSPEDGALLLRFEAADQVQNELTCVVIALPLAEPTPSPPESGPGNQKVLGYVCALISVLFFGTNFLPVKQFDTGDGVFFQVRCQHPHGRCKDDVRLYCDA